ncbi:hypothetical protein GS429_12935 [Natronorubrum sp. JWXQ-INN-674]|uniref:DUF7974 domain-containing protein n=1 Tax=Natronorubrum halalkaliphilum TaxID=2691917 RepID=A0A6B0VPA1_9EURY|nr:hypothetical protein [Natronorubrum halalkaliphilum]MXV62957.1 hypothetical protein [Natronorubrum halalkaliphilum]
MVGPQPPHDTETNGYDDFETEADDSRYSVATFLAALVPTALARRVVSVSLETDRDVYERDEPVEVTVDFKNRFPLPVSIPTPRQRRWGWTIDGELEASDERRYTRSRPSAFRFSGGERKQVSFTWNGRFERTAERGMDESVVPSPGEYELRVFIATDGDRYQPSDATTIRIR